MAHLLHFFCLRRKPGCEVRKTRWRTKLVLLWNLVSISLLRVCIMSTYSFFHVGNQHLTWDTSYNQFMMFFFSRFSHRRNVNFIVDFHSGVYDVVIGFSARCAVTFSRQTILHLYINSATAYTKVLDEIKHLFGQI